MGTGGARNAILGRMLLHQECTIMEIKKACSEHKHNNEKNDGTACDQPSLTVMEKQTLKTVKDNKPWKTDCSPESRWRQQQRTTTAIAESALKDYLQP